MVLPNRSNGEPQDYRIGDKRHAFFRSVIDNIVYGYDQRTQFYNVTHPNVNSNVTNQRWTITPFYGVRIPKNRTQTENLDRNVNSGTLNTTVSEDFTDPAFSVITYGERIKTSYSRPLRTFSYYYLQIWAEYDRFTIT